MSKPRRGGCGGTRICPRRPPTLRGLLITVVRGASHNGTPSHTDRHEGPETPRKRSPRGLTEGLTGRRICAKPTVGEKILFGLRTMKVAGKAYILVLALSVVAGCPRGQRGLLGSWRRPSHPHVLPRRFPPENVGFAGRQRLLRRGRRLAESR